MTRDKGAGLIARFRAKAAEAREAIDEAEAEVEAAIEAEIDEPEAVEPEPQPEPEPEPEADTDDTVVDLEDGITEVDEVIHALLQGDDDAPWGEFKPLSGVIEAATGPQRWTLRKVALYRFDHELYPLDLSVPNGTPNEAERRLAMAGLIDKAEASECITALVGKRTKASGYVRITVESEPWEHPTLGFTVIPDRVAVDAWWARKADRSYPRRAAR